MDSLLAACHKAGFALFGNREPWASGKGKATLAIKNLDDVIQKYITYTTKDLTHIYNSYLQNKSVKENYTLS